jgi:hypothetical protein
MSADLERQLRERLRDANRHDAPDSLYASLEEIIRTKPQPTPKRDIRRTLRLLSVAAILVVGGSAAIVAGSRWLDPPPVVSSPIPSASLPTLTASESVDPTASPTASPSTPAPPSGGGAPTIPVGASAAPIGERLIMAPGLGGSLFVTIPAPDGAVLLHLDRTGAITPGWPLRIAGTTACPVLLAVDDGSIRAVCSSRDVSPREAAEARAFAFDATGAVLAGWPADLGPTNQLDEPALYTGRMFGGELWLSVSTKTAYQFVRVTVVTAGGEVRRGADLALSDCCDDWVIGPDRVAYGVGRPSDLTTTELDPARMTAVDRSGRRPGWPMDLNGIPSAPALHADGRAIVVLGNIESLASQVLTIEADGTVAGPAEILVRTLGPSGRCPPVQATPPIAADDGTTVVSGLDRTVGAFDASVKPRSGWPFEAQTTLARIGFDDPLASQFCPSIAAPAVGPDGTVVLPLAARESSVGGSLVAVGRDGEVRAGWPVELVKPGAAFWSVAVAADGTVYALAVEPEAASTFSATILAIAPDSTILSRTTIIEPGTP